jgi:ABC transporter with metal-binding/Fe-S-binding domain ATP-binding protein
MKVGVLVSGGKDSTLTLWLALHQYNVTNLITVLSIKESTLFQHQTRSYIEAYSEAVQIPVKIIEVTDEEKELIELEKGIKELDVEAILIGGLLSEYQRFKFNSVALNLGIPCYAPIWRKNQKMLLEEMKSHDFKIILSLVAGLGFEKSDVGVEIDDQQLKRLEQLEKKYGLSIGGEGGEYETLVLDAPFFKKKIELTEKEVIFDEIRSMGFLQIKKVHVIGKEMQ